jgi:predicted Zn-dependent protease
LEKWQDQQDKGDYFSLIENNLFGYLIFSNFPLKVYLEHPINPDPNVASDQRFLQWVEIVKSGIKDWEKYFPLTFVDNGEEADILIERATPPRRREIDPQTGRIIITRAKTAQTKYEFYLSSHNPPILRHRMKIMISPGKNPEALLSASRHEFGHALGIWGHSDLETDIMYYAQVRDYPPISPRDINTLKKIYQQPTRIGWPLNMS